MFVTFLSLLVVWQTPHNSTASQGSRSQFSLRQLLFLGRDGLKRRRLIHNESFWVRVKGRCAAVQRTALGVGRA